MDDPHKRVRMVSSFDPCWRASLDQYSFGVNVFVTFDPTDSILRLSRVR